MSTFPGSSRFVKGGLVLVESGFGRGAKNIVLRYNLDTLKDSCDGNVIEGSVR